MCSVNNFSVEEVSLVKGEECIETFKSYCDELNFKFNSKKPTIPAEKIIKMALILLSYWYTEADVLDEEALEKHQKFLQKVITYTVVHRDTMSTLN